MKFLLLLAFLFPPHAHAAKLKADTGVLGLDQWTTTQGETPTFAFIAQDDGGHAIDLTGGVFTSFVKGELGEIVPVPNNQHAINFVQSGATRGKFTVFFSSGNTSDFAAGTYKGMVTMVVQSSIITYLHGTNILTVLPNVPTQ